MITASSLVGTVASAFIVTFATVVLPSPSTLAAARATLEGGTRAASAFLSALLLLDACVFLVLVFGVHPLLRDVGIAHRLPPIAGVILVVVGLVMIVRARGHERSLSASGATTGGSPTKSMGGPFVTAIAVNVGNPGFWLWWATVGTSFIHAARHWGDVGLTLLLLAFLGGTVSWYVPLLWALHHGREIFLPGLQKRLRIWFGVALVAFGIYLVWHWLAAP